MLWKSRRANRSRFSVVAVMGAALALSACSTVSDTLFGSSAPADQTPTGEPRQTAQQPSNGGFVADTANARYTDEDVAAPGTAAQPLAPPSEVVQAPEPAPAQDAPMPMAQPAPAPQMAAAPAPAPVQPTAAESKFQPMPGNMPAPGEPLEPVAPPTDESLPPPDLTSIPAAPGEAPIPQMRQPDMTGTAPLAPVPMPQATASVPMDDAGYQTVVIGGDGVETNDPFVGDGFVPLSEFARPGAGAAEPMVPTAQPYPDNTVVAAMEPAVPATSMSSIREQLLRPDAPINQARPLEQFDPMVAGVSYHAGTLLFNSGGAAISTAGQKILRDVAAMVKEYGGTVRVVGHASARTRDMELTRHQRVNYEVSLQRADAAVGALMRAGLAAEQIYAGAVGEAEPRYYEIMPTGEAGNRRVEIYVDY